MKIYKVGTWISVISGILTLIVGVYLSLSNIISTGYTAGLSGNIHEGRLTGFSGIFLGILLLLLSVWAYYGYKEEKKRFEELDNPKRKRIKRVNKK